MPAKGKSVLEVGPGHTPGGYNKSGTPRNSPQAAMRRALKASGPPAKKAVGVKTPPKLISEGGNAKLKLPRGSKHGGGGRTKHSKSTGRFIS
jgi:hypothetical protein